MRPRPAREEAVQGACHRTEERIGDPGGRLHAHGVAVAGDVLDRDPAARARDPHADGAPARLQLAQPQPGGRDAPVGARSHLVRREIAEAAQEVMYLVHGRGPAIVCQRLECQLEVRERRRIQQLTQLLLAQQLAEQVAVQREGLRPALGQRRVALVHVRGHVVEQQRGRERRRPRRLHRMHGDLSAGDAAEHVAERRQVEDVRQALAVRLHEDREGAVPGRHGEKVCCPLALLPQGRPGAGPPPRQQQRTRRVLAEPGCEEGRVRDGRDDEILDLLRIREEQVVDPGQVALGEPDGDSVVRPDRLHFGPEAFAQACLQRQRPRRVDPRAERCQEAESPVAQLVAESLHDDPPVRRQRPSGLALVLQVREQVLRREVVQVVLLGQPREGGPPSALAPPDVALELAHEGAQRPSQLDRPPDGVAVPEGKLAGHTRRRRHEHPIGPDLVDPPRRRTQGDHVADAGLVHHLLVELADAPARRAGLAHEEDREEAAVRDRAAAGDRDDARVAAALDHAGQAIPGDPGLQLGELVRGVGAREHREDAFQRLAREVLERRGVTGQVRDLVHRPAVHDGHGHDLLRQHVQRVARQRRGLDRPRVHALRDDGALQQIAAVFREDHAFAGRAHLVARPTDPLQAACHGRGTLNLDHEIHRAHVDAQLQAGGGDERRQAARLQLLLDREALLAGDAAVVRTHELFARQLVQALREALREASAVAEDDRGAV